MSIAHLYCGHCGVATADGRAAGGWRPRPGAGWVNRLGGHGYRCHGDNGHRCHLGLCMPASPMACSDACEVEMLVAAGWTRESAELEAGLNVDALSFGLAALRQLSGG